MSVVRTRCHNCQSPIFEFKHGDEDPHRHGMAVDVRPTGDYESYKCAAKMCGAYFTQSEGNRYHSQLTKKGTFKQ